MAKKPRPAIAGRVMPYVGLITHKGEKRLFYYLFAAIASKIVQGVINHNFQRLANDIAFDNVICRFKRKN